MEDGCSKRFDIGTMDLRAENASNTASAKRQYSGKNSNGNRAAVTSRTSTLSGQSQMPTMSVTSGIGVMPDGVTQSETSWAAAH